MLLQYASVYGLIKQTKRQTNEIRGGFNQNNSSGLKEKEKIVLINE